MSRAKAGRQTGRAPSYHREFTYSHSPNWTLSLSLSGRVTEPSAGSNPALGTPPVGEPLLCETAQTLLHFMGVESKSRLMYLSRRANFAARTNGTSSVRLRRVRLMVGITKNDREKLKRGIESDSRLPYEIEQERTLESRQRTIIDEDDCGLIRCLRAFGKTAPRIAEELDAEVSPSAISTHARGACTHDTDVPPTVLHREASDGVGEERAINHEETQKRRREWREERER